MKFLNDVFARSCVLILLAMICALVYEKYIVPRRQANNPKQPEPQTISPLAIYEKCRIIYEEMGYCLYMCLNSVDRVCFLDCPNDVQKIYAAQVADRVKRLNGRILFCYEAKRTGVQSGLNKKTVYSNTCDDITRILKANLPAHLTPGLSFSDIVVYDIGNDYVKIVIENINKVMTNCNTCYTGGNYGGYTVGGYGGNYMGGANNGGY